MPRMTTAKLMDPAEFQSLGFLHEVNRLVLHPAGLALAVLRNDDGSVQLHGIIDRRNDPEGMVFNEVEPDLIASVCREASRHAPYRRTLLAPNVADFGEVVVQTLSLTDTQMSKPEPTWERVS